MATKKYLDLNGLSYFWNKIKTYISNVISVKADRVANPTEGNIVVLTGSGNLADSGKSFNDITVEVTVESITGGNKVTIIDEANPNGQSFNVLNGVDAVNPFKGWWPDLATLKAAITASPGDSAYVKDASPATTWSIYEYNSAASSDNYWADSGTDADASNVQTFKTGEEVNNVGIDNTLTDPTSSDVAGAKISMQLATKLNGISATVSQLETNKVTQIAISGADGHIVNSANGIACEVSLPSGVKKVRFLGWNMVASSNVNNYGWCFGKQTDPTKTYLQDWTQLKWGKYDNTAQGSFAEKEYVVTDIPSDATTLLFTLKTAYIPELTSTYCYSYNGDTVLDVILENKVDVIDSLNSDEGAAALSAKQGKALDENKQDKNFYSLPYYEGVNSVSVYEAYIAGTRLPDSTSFRTSLFPVEAGKTYRLHGKFGNGSGSRLYAFMSGSSQSDFIHSYEDATGRERTELTVEVTIPENTPTITHVAVEWGGSEARATCEEKKVDTLNIEDELNELMEGKEFNILCLGNSFTEDTMSYVPYILKESGLKKYKFNIYLTYISGASLAVYKRYVEGEEIQGEITPKLHISIDGSPWDSQSLPAFLELIAMKNWDLITIQQAGSYNYTDYGTNFRPYINAICQQIQMRANTGVKIGYIMSHASYVNTTDTLSFDTETTRLEERYEGTNEYPGISSNARSVLAETPISVLLPYGTAIQNLRTASYLNELGTKGHLSNDHIHLCDGLPCLCAAYTNAMVILSYCTGEQTILSNPINPSTAFLNEKNIPGRNSSVGLTAYNMRIAQTCAMLAIKKPFELSNIKEIGLIGDYKVSLMGANYDFNNPILSANVGESWSNKLTANDGYSIQSVEVTMGGSVVSGAYDATTGIVYISNVTGDIIITPTLTQI